jgi:hypothetical protein
VLTTSIGQVRLLIRDTDSSNALFSDEEITALLNLYDNDVKIAAANALLAISHSKALLAKYKSAGKYAEDTRSIAKELREGAKMLLELGQVPWDTVAEQTFGPADERALQDREDIRGEA